ncbi:leukocyte elastase inhibitor-like isoform X9 [Zophobas morio]|uniref:leukocyte elastase inhibitor-like isoform X9 n=1 Tax=Zophobas morio TaxID=2755281 RepID=UPI003083563D
MVTIIKTRAKVFQYFHSAGKVDLSFLLILLGIVFGVLLSSSTMAEKTAELQVLESNRQFTTSLYNVLAEKAGNVFFSPISVHAVLSMSYQGAKGTTAEKYAATLNVPEAKAAAEGYNVVMNRLNSVPNVTLLMANRVYLMDGYELVPEFSNAVTKNFLSEVQLVNFGANEAAAATINAWVEEKTKEKIKDLISKDDLNGLTRLVLVNAIYFKGDWKHKFDKAATKTEPFYLNDVDSIDVSMMHTKKKFNYKSDEALDAQILEMSYTNEDLSMFIILPNKRNGIAELEKKLATANLTEITQHMWNTEVNVALPRFKVETTMDLKDSLTKLGLGEIFSPGSADFSGMITAKEQLYVSKVIQKAFIEVNEEGAEAAAATAIRPRDLCFNMMVKRVFEVIADHPFAYIVIDKITMNSLFLGRFSEV